MGILASLTLPALPARSAGDNKTQLVTASLTSTLAVLILSSNTVTFNSQNPNQVPTISSNEGPITVRCIARTSRFGSVRLTVQANGPLISGSDVIPIGAVRWTATGAGFADGIHSNLAPVNVASWTGPGNREGTMNHTFLNRWYWTAGNYTATLTYTLTSL